MDTLKKRLEKLEQDWKNNKLDTLQLKTRIMVLAYPNNNMIDHWLRRIGY